MGGIVLPVDDSTDNVCFLQNLDFNPLCLKSLSRCFFNDIVA